MKYPLPAATISTPSGFAIAKIDVAEAVDEMLRQSPPRLWIFAQDTGESDEVLTFNPYSISQSLSTTPSVSATAWQTASSIETFLAGGSWTAGTPIAARHGFTLSSLSVDTVLTRRQYFRSAGDLVALAIAGALSPSVRVLVIDQVTRRIAFRTANPSGSGVANKTTTDGVLFRSIERGSFAEFLE